MRTRTTELRQQNELSEKILGGLMFATFGGLLGATAVLFLAPEDERDSALMGAITGAVATGTVVATVADIDIVSDEGETATPSLTIRR